MKRDSPSTPLCEIAGATKIFPGGVRALDDVSLAIAPGEFFTLLGPSGCGKTTVLRLLAGFEHPDAGDVRLDGRSVLGEPPNRRPVNILFQSYALFPHMNVAANVAFGLESRGLRGPAVRDRVAAMLALVRLESLASRRPAQLSGGQQQRVALARALAPAPRLVLLDEPLSALDPKLRREMQGELKRIQRETGVAFLLVTHDQEEALSMSDRIAVMEGGRIRQVGTPAEIHGRPSCRFVADFMGANVLPGALAGLNAAWAAIGVEAVEIKRRDVATDGALPGRVETLTFLGARTACAVILAGGARLVAERGDLPRDLAIGDAVVCRLPRDTVVPLED